jgi:hypothetical protein
MRMILATATFAFLAACSGTAGNKAAGNVAAPANAVAPAPANAISPANALGDARRADMVRECSDDVRNEVPAGTDLDAFCGCAVDRMQGASGERQAMEACAAEMGIRPRP